MAELRSEIPAIGGPTEIRRGCQRNLRIGTSPLLIFETRCLEADRVVEPLDGAVRIVHLKQRRALVRDQALTVDEKFVALGLAAEHWMVIEHEAIFALASLALK